jgi:hypothetical protein
MLDHAWDGQSNWDSLWILANLPNDQPFECMELSMIIAPQIHTNPGLHWDFLSGSTVTDLKNEYFLFYP